MNTLETMNCFVSSISTIEKTEFLNSVNSVVSEELNFVKNNSEVCDLYHTGDISQDDRISEFSSYVGSTAWNILKAQGYKMQNKNVFFESMWCQEYAQNSYMPEHVHPNNGAQLVGFYFLECSEDCPVAIFHDPRPGKVQISMEQENNNEITYGSNNINIKPKVGLLVFTNAWLPHSFSQNKSNKMFKFIHFNVGVSDAPLNIIQQAEVI